ncbi:MAG: beta-ketoacyl-[acyl-carrier-protein] synthase family protein [Holophagales bacterium]|nr:beta-ketoacyl-[acyl-carrier-protein] synthase family protein [Holophagales bacterium]
MSARRRVVVTGAGLVAPGAPGVAALWENLLAGRSAVGPIRRFDASTFPTRIAAEADAPSGDAARPLGSDLGGRGRIWDFGVEAASQALAAAGLAPRGPWSASAGLSIATGMGTYGHAEVFGAAAAGAARDGFDGKAFAQELLYGLLPHAADRQSPGALAARLARAAGIGGPLLASMTACAGGTEAIGDAFRWIRRGEADVVLAGASDSEIYPMGLASFCLLGALSRRNEEPTRASRPFDGERDGFVLGEGAGFVVLEELEHARARGADVLAEVAGFGSACDAWRATDPHPDGLGAVLAMRRALDDAVLSSADVGYVNAHGTSTPGGDRAEARALGSVFGSRLGEVAVSSTKSMIGHLTVAAGAVEAIVTALSLRDGLVHPTLNQEHRDPECEVDTVPEGARRVDLRAALSNSFAFGGQTACLAFVRA